jgi:GNAT superfamily N-acetyltransferase
MREALDRKPYDFIQDDLFFQKGMDTVYLLLDGDEIIGSVTIKDDEIDDLLVNRLYQGQGYGKGILLFHFNMVECSKVNNYELNNYSFFVALLLLFQKKVIL